MAGRVLLVRPALPVSALVSHLRPIPHLQQLPPLLFTPLSTDGFQRSTPRRFTPEPEFTFNSADARRSRFASMATAPSGTETAPTSEEEEERKTHERIITHQRAASRLSHVDEARTVVNTLGNGVLSTISKRFQGFPVGSMVHYAADEDGRILLSISSLSPHTADLQADSKCSILVAKDPNDKSDVVVTIIGEASVVSEADEASARSAFLKKHPGAFWVDFGDFRFVRIEPKGVRYVSGIVTGLATVAQFSGEEYKAGKVDPISQFGAPIANHMNRDHADQTRQIVEDSVGVKVGSAVIQDVDSLGFNVVSEVRGKPMKLRVPFPRKAETRKDVKTLIVEMLKGGPSQGN